MAFGGILRQSTSVDVLIGPFMDETNGKDIEAGLTIEDEHVLLSKNGQGLTAKTDANNAANDGGTAYYNCPLDTTDTNTVGQLTLTCHMSGALPIRFDFQVMDTVPYDEMFKDAAAGMQGVIEVNNLDSIKAETAAIKSAVMVYSGEVASASSDTIVFEAGPVQTADYYNKSFVVIIAGDGIGQTRKIINWTTLTASISPNWKTQPSSNSTAVILPFGRVMVHQFDSTALGQIEDEAIDALESFNLDKLMAVDTGVAADANLDGIIVDGSVLAHILTKDKTTDSYNASTHSLQAIKEHADTIKAETVLIVEDTGELQGDDIPGKIATLDTVVDGVETKVDTAITDIAAVKSETASIQTETTALDTLTQAAGDGDLAAILVDTNAIQGKLPANKFMGSSDGADDDGTLNTIAGDVANIDGIVPAAVADLGTVQSGDSFAIVNGVAGLVAINSDVEAILNDTGTGGVLVSATAIAAIWAKAMSDLDQGAPSATASVLTAINYLYEAWRNKTTTTATLITIMKDDGSTGLVKSVISDDATTFTKGELISGA